MKEGENKNKKVTKSNETKRNEKKRKGQRKKKE